MQNDIIDNRHEKLVDHILAILPQLEHARFAVGYLFLSGLEALGDNLNRIKELHLLIGNTSNRETIELLAEGHQRLDIVKDRQEEISISSNHFFCRYMADNFASLWLAMTHYGVLWILV